MNKIDRNREIIKEYRQGERLVDIATKHSITKTCVTNIINTYNGLFDEPLYEALLEFNPTSPDLVMRTYKALYKYAYKYKPELLKENRIPPASVSEIDIKQFRNVSYVGAKIADFISDWQIYYKG